MVGGGDICGMMPAMKLCRGEEWGEGEGVVIGVGVLKEEVGGHDGASDGDCLGGDVEEDGPGEIGERGEGGVCGVEAQGVEGVQLCGAVVEGVGAPEQRRAVEEAM